MNSELCTQFDFIFFIRIPRSNKNCSLVASGSSGNDFILRKHSKEENLINFCFWRIINVSFVLVNVIWKFCGRSFSSLRSNLCRRKFLFQNGRCRKTKNHQINQFCKSCLINVLNKLRLRCIENFEVESLKALL